MEERKIVSQFETRCYTTYNAMADSGTLFFAPPLVHHYRMFASKIYIRICIF